MLLSFHWPKAGARDAGLPRRAKPHYHVPVSPRGEHARLLGIAAARRLRALDRLRSQRLDDAEYWIACAPVAVSKAAALRADMTPLP
jgi:hypothetical protein